MKFFTAFAVLAAVVSAAPSAYSFEARDDKCLPQRIAVVVLDNSYSTTFADEKNLRQEVPRKVFAKMTPDEDKGAFLSTEYQGPQVLAAMNTVNALEWPAPGRGYTDRPLVEIINAATKHIKDTIKEDFRDRAAIVFVSDAWDNTDGNSGWHPGQIGVKTAQAIRDAKDLGIRVHWGKPNQHHDVRDIGEVGSAVLESGGWYSELNDGGGLDYFIDQLFKKGLTNKDQECGTPGKPDPIPTPSSTEKPPPTSEAPPPTSSQAPPPTSEAPPPTSSQAPPPTSEAPPPTSSAAPPPSSKPSPAPTECSASVSTVTDKVTEKVTETVKETVTAPAPSATSGKVCLAPCDVPGAKPLPEMPKFEL